MRVPAAGKQGCHGHTSPHGGCRKHGESREAEQERTSRDKETRDQGVVKVGWQQSRDRLSISEITFFLDLFLSDAVEVILIHRLLEGHPSFTAASVTLPELG